MISPIATLEDVGRDLEASGQLLNNWHTAWDADDCRPLCTLKDALDLQQQALRSLLQIVEREQVYRRATGSRIERLEYR